MKTKIPAAFTLVELLVVITIIVILLALLAPALETAIYQSELAVCATRLKGTGTGVQVYAHNFRRSYPDRPSVRMQGVPPPRINHFGNPLDNTITAPCSGLI